MKYTWEECDIRCGRRFFGSNRTENSESIIGYQYDGEGKVLSFISLSDGNIWHKESTRASAAQYLNDLGSRPAAIELPDILEIKIDD